MSPERRPSDSERGTTAARDGAIAPALAQLLAKPGLQRLWGAARQRIETLGGVRGRLRLDELDNDERQAIADLLGLRRLPSTERPFVLDLKRLDATLRASRFAIGLEAALRARGGRLRDRPAERQAEQDFWQAFWRRARRHPQLPKLPASREWLDDLATTGLYRRLAKRRDESPDALLERALQVLSAIPTTAASDDQPSDDQPSDDQPGTATVRLAVLASQTLGDSHALDPQHRVAALVLRALAHREGWPMPNTAARRRALWARHGVICDDLSCDVLVAGLRPGGDALLARTLRQHAEVGEPLRLTLRQLAASPAIGSLPGGIVWVCENPAVVAMAVDDLGNRCPPMVCLAGQPNTAAHLLLTRLRQHGAELRYHGDFDWGGLNIGNTLWRSLPFTPWRFTADDYRQLARQLANSDDLPRLSGKPVAAEWDPNLATAMQEMGRVVEEEAVIEPLLEDLRKLA